jgi:hypothetical protein
MMKGGTPDPGDFTYSVPSYNTELEVLYWLACQNEFKKNDTLVLAIAMANGFWVTIGNQDVKEAVRSNVNDLLVFFRETNEMQTERGYVQLEQYPLEAKLLLAWVGPTNNLCSWCTHRLQDHSTKIATLHDYEWMVTDVSTLRLMRTEMDKRMWIDSDTNVVVANLESYFYFGNSVMSPHWNYTCYGRVCPPSSPPTSETITIDGEKTRPVGFRNMNWLYQYYLQTGDGIGACIDETPFVRAFLQSWGISASAVDIENEQTAHTYVIYFDPAAGSWKAYSGQLLNGGAGTVASFSLSTDFYVFKPPVQQRGYFSVSGYGPTGAPYFEVSDYTIKGTTLDTIMMTLSAPGVGSQEMKQWLLYRSYGSLNTVESSMMFKIDGNGKDWSNFTAIMSKGPTQSTTPGRDLQAVYAVADGKYLYIMIKLYGQPDPGNNYIIPLDLTGTGKWDYSFGFNVNSVWMYDLRGIPNGQWPDSRLSTPDAIYAVAAVAEIAIPLEIIGNPTRINIADVWIYYRSLGETVDQFGKGASVPFITSPTSTTTTSSVSQYATTTATETSSTSSTSAMASLRRIEVGSMSAFHRRSEVFLAQMKLFR